jgi:hypothetical protein
MKMGDYDASMGRKDVSFVATKEETLKKEPEKKTEKAKEKK